MSFLDDPTTEPATAALLARTTPALRIVFSGDRIVWREHLLTIARNDIGRGAPTPGFIHLESDARLSRQHATFVVHGDRLHLENHSAHGSFVNGFRIDKTTELREGDVVRFGDTFAVLRHVAEAPRDAPVASILGRAPAMAHLRSLIGVVGPARASVLLLGETGAGKDVAARALHERSGRKGPFIAVNCAAIPENLAESQLFGHSAGSFTGAHKDHTGFFREAQGGTLFLDEVGELPLALQPKLLRALDERSVLAVGASTGTPVDVRLVAATNREIAREVESGAFRGDLFARLAEITISLPPLRARIEDVLLLLERELPGLATGDVQISPALVGALLLHAWPFNVRELMKIATELSVKAQGRMLLDVDLLEGRILGPAGPASPPPPPSSLKEELPAPTKGELEMLLLAHKGKISHVARATGRSRTQVYRWLEDNGLEVARFRS